MNDIEVWKQYPDIQFIETSTLGRVRTLNRKVSQGRSKRLVKGHVLKQYDNGHGYLYVQFSVDGKNVHKLVHRLVAETFISNPNNLTEVNHKDNNPLKNNVSNLEWCTHKYNIEYREKHGVSAKEYISKKPVLAVSLKTLEVFKFKSQREAGRELGIAHSNINNVIKGRYGQTGGYWFTDDESKINKNKLREINNNTPFRGGVFAVNLETLEVFKFKSQSVAAHRLKINKGSVSDVIKGRLKQVRGYWFVRADSSAVESTRVKFGDSVARRVKEFITDK